MFDNLFQKENTNKDGSDVTSLLQHPNLAVWDLIFDSLPDLIALIDNHSRIVKVNRAMLDKLALGELNITGHKCFELIHEGKCKVEDCPHAQMLVDKKVHISEFFEPKFNSYYKVTTTPIFDNNNVLLGSLHQMHDITIEKDSEAKLLKYNAELEELNRNKDKFFSIVAHDLRSPFQGMLGFTDLILDEIDILSKEEIQNYLLHVQESSYSAFSLLENLLSWSKLQTGRLNYNPNNFDVFKEINSVISLLNSNAVKKGLTIVNKIPVSTIVFADQQMIHSVILNLLTNAIKFSNPNTSILIGYSFLQEQHQEAHKSQNSVVKYLEIQVSDSGVGISSEMINHLEAKEKQISSTGTQSETGSGIGLFIVREMLEKHGSSLSIKSTLGEGSTFSFKLLISDRK